MKSVCAQTQTSCMWPRLSGHGEDPATSLCCCYTTAGNDRSVSEQHMAISSDKMKTKVYVL